MDVNGILFFTINDYYDNNFGLWKSDGTETGTVLVKDDFRVYGNPANVNGTLFFSAQNNGTNDYELWKSDGTEVGTVLVKDILLAGAQGSFPQNLTSVGGTLFFTATNGTNGRELWKSDGTAGGTLIIKDINNGTFASDPECLTNVNGTLFFTADDGINGRELWKSDGTTAGTLILMDICNGTSSSEPENLISYNGKLFFTANNGTNGNELWMSDGTPSGTLQVKDIYSGALSSSPNSLTCADELLFFVANDGIHGGELWSSDGTEGGTLLRSDINIGNTSSDINPLTATDQRLLFSANSESFAESIWTFNYHSPPTLSLNNSAIDLDTCLDTGVMITWPQDPVAWNDDENGARTYDVTRDGVDVAGSIPYGTTNFVDMEGVNGQPYLYQVRYRNGYGLAATTLGASAHDWGPLPTISGPTPACQTAMLSTQNFNTFQWYRNGSLISGATNQYYSAVAPGNYTVFVTDSQGCTATSPAFVVYSYPSTPTITGPSSGCGSVTLSTGTYTSYQWLKDSINIDGATSKDYSATTGGTYSVRVGNAGGCTATSAGKAVTVFSNPNPVVTGQETGCDSVPLSTGVFASYQWIKNGDDIPGETSQNYSAIQSGTYSVRVTSADGCMITSAGKVVTVNITPDTPTIYGSDNGCESVELSTEVYASYQWIKNGLVIPDANSQTYTATMSANYIVQVAGVGGCNASSLVKAVTIYPNPHPVITGDNACNSVTLSTGAFANYQWLKGGIEIIGATGQSHVTSESGTFSVRVTSTDGCVVVSPEKVITVYQSPTPMVVGGNSGCSSVSLSTQAYASYQWIKDDLDIPGAQSQNYTATQSGTFSVRVSTSDGCTATSAGKSISIYPFPTPAISGDHFNLCPATSVALSTGTFSSYQWYLDNLLIPGATFQTYDAKTSGNYKIQVTSSDGCSGTSLDFQVFVDFCAESEVSPSDAIYPSRLVKDGTSSTGYYLYFQRLDTLDGYNIYEGDIVSPWDGSYHHAGKAGTVCHATVIDLCNGEMRAEITPSEGNHYYLVTAYGGGVEGPSGFNSDDVEIDTLQSTCSP